MGLSRSQVHKSVVALEDTLGAQLLLRTTRKVSSTPSGEAFYERAKQILADLTEAESAIRAENEGPSGRLRLNAPMSFGSLHVGKALAEFISRHPALQIELSLNDRFIDPLDDGFDATIRIAEPDQSATLVEHPIAPIQRYFLASPDFLTRHGPIGLPDQLKSLPCLHYGNLGDGHIWRIQGKDETHAVKVNGVMCSNNGEVLCDAAIKGLGVALLPTFIAGPAMQSGELVRILPDYAPPDIHLMMLYPPNRHLAPKVRSLLEFLYERFGDRQVWDLLD